MNSNSESASPCDMLLTGCMGGCALSFLVPFLGLPYIIHNLIDQMHTYPISFLIVLTYHILTYTILPLVF